jgi:hypothetical protein
LITSAPIAARYRVAVGPAITQLKSSTLMPASGRPVLIGATVVSVCRSRNPKGEPGTRTALPSISSVRQKPRWASCGASSCSAGSHNGKLGT